MSGDNMGALVATAPVMAACRGYLYLLYVSFRLVKVLSPVFLAQLQKSSRKIAAQA
jgi:hypothetical protein